MKLIKWFKEAIIETLNQTWTLLGMFIAWCVLDGSAKSVVGVAIIYSLALWLLTMWVRVPRKDDSEDK
jgi:hypothetical protein